MDKNINTSVLAYMGDAVYEVRIRRMLVESEPNRPEKLHVNAIKYVSAEGQAKAAKEMLEGDFLNEDEKKLLKRARNHRVSSQPRHADKREYKLATGFEALLGYLFLDEQLGRMIEVVDEAVRIIGSV